MDTSQLKNGKYFLGKFDEPNEYRGTIKATVSYEKKYWVVVFELVDDKKISLARKIFPSEPTDPQIYEYIRIYFAKLKFSEPQKYILQIKRKNPKRIQREIKKEITKLSSTHKKESYAQEMIRLEMEKNKTKKKRVAKIEKIREEQKKFELKQKKKKQKQKGH